MNDSPDMVPTRVMPLQGNDEPLPKLDQLVYDDHVIPTLEQVFALARKLSRSHQQALHARLDAMLQTPPVEEQQSERAWKNYQALREILAQMPQHMSAEDALNEVRGKSRHHVHD